MNESDETGLLCDSSHHGLTDALGLDPSGQGPVSSSSHGSHASSADMIRACTKAKTTHNPSAPPLVVLATHGNLATKQPNSVASTHDELTAPRTDAAEMYTTSESLPVAERELMLLQSTTTSSHANAVGAQEWEEETNLQHS
eukprot:TRINITY_DN104788_c0_g1_i1.p2 TRINITY_DN104788_c0_g1~~TRINITY_DN104788_c0_g1_i1.p2  ORF type:complete len:142 (-),score=11.36 TRINITY_DN104788_c0_g1_i1:372-797(-)